MGLSFDLSWVGDEEFVFDNQRARSGFIAHLTRA
jgi:hypothetical protein